MTLSSPLGLSGLKSWAYCLFTWCYFMYVQTIYVLTVFWKQLHLGERYGQYVKLKNSTAMNNVSQIKSV